MPGGQLHKMGAAEERSSVEGAAPRTPSGEADFREEGVRSMSDVADTPNTGRARHRLPHLAGWRALATSRYKGAIHSLEENNSESSKVQGCLFLFKEKRGKWGQESCMCACLKFFLVDGNVPRRGSGTPGKKEGGGGRP